MSAVRLHKAIADAGIASRRAAEEMIRRGKVTVNGQVVTEMGVTVDPNKDSITVDGSQLGKADRKRTYIFYKPLGLLCTRDDPHGRPTVFDILPDEVGTGLHTAGRLDMDAEGLLILTNDGDLTLTLTHPSSHLPKTYLVKVKGETKLSALKKLRRGVELEDGVTLPASVSVIKGKGTERNTWLRMVLREGKKNQIKRMGEAVGNRVISIKRISIGGMELPEKMKPGSFKKLSKKEIETLLGGRRDKADQSPSAFADAHRTASTDRKSKGQRDRADQRPMPKGQRMRRGEVREQTDTGKPRRGDTETRRRGESREQTDPGTPFDQASDFAFQATTDRQGRRRRGDTLRPGSGQAAIRRHGKGREQTDAETRRRGEGTVMSPDSRPERDKRVASRVQSEDLKPGAESEGTRSRKGWAVKKPKAKSRGGGPKKAIRRGEKAAQSPSTFAKATADKTADRKPKGQRGKPGEISKSENKGTPPDKLRTNKPRPGGASRGPGKGGRRGKA